MMKLLTHTSTFGRDSVAPTGIIIADNPPLRMTGHFFLEQLWQA